MVFCFLCTPSNRHISSHSTIAYRMANVFHLITQRTLHFSSNQFQHAFINNTSPRYHIVKYLERTTNTARTAETDVRMKQPIHRRPATDSAANTPERRHFLSLQHISPIAQPSAVRGPYLPKNKTLILIPTYHTTPPLATRYAPHVATAVQPPYMTRKHTHCSESCAGKYPIQRRRQHDTVITHDNSLGDGFIQSRFPRE